MDNMEYPRLSGGTFMTLVIEALKERTKAREHYKGESDNLNDPDVLAGLIMVINPDYQYPGKKVLKSKANDFKACKLSTGKYLPFGKIKKKIELQVFDERVRADYVSARNDMSVFIENFIETGTKLKKDIRLVKALMELIDKDLSILPDKEFYSGKNGETIRKEDLVGLTEVCLPSFLLGIWHFIVTERPDNAVGKATYDIWCPENGGGSREYGGTMGDTITREIKVEVLKPIFKTEDDVEVVNISKETPGDDPHKEDPKKESLQQEINNPFTFIQNGNNNTQIGYIANQTIIRK